MLFKLIQLIKKIKSVVEKESYVPSAQLIPVNPGKQEGPSETVEEDGAIRETDPDDIEREKLKKILDDVASSEVVDKLRDMDKENPADTLEEAEGDTLTETLDEVEAETLAD